MFGFILSVLSYSSSDTAFSFSKYTYRTRIKGGRLVIGYHTLIQVCLLDKPSAFYNCLMKVETQHIIIM